MSVVAAFGGGVNSQAYMIGLWERGETVDLILMSDTGDEKPHTYRAVEQFQDWLANKGFPPITMVRKEGLTLEQDCLNRKALPSVAYGFKSCSDHFKIRPQQAYLKANNIEVTQMIIGIDAGEQHRAKDIPINRYPLIEWGWGREECEEAIKRAGLPLPGKSACFFCPSSKKWEIKQLRRMYPDLAARAVAMENNADLTLVKGLGRDFAWRDLYEAEDRQVDMFAESVIEMDCGCYDG